MNSGLPVLKDLSPEGRSAFLEAWEPVLLAYWSEAFTEALVNDEDWLRASEARAAGRDDFQAGQWIAQGIIDSLRTRPRLDRAPAWTNLPGWYTWWVGKRAASAQRRASTFMTLDEEGPEAGAGSTEDAMEEQLDQKRRMKALLELIDAWADVLRRISISTGLPDIEADWLWATCIARRRLAQWLRAMGMGDVRFQEVDKSLLTARTSVPGHSPPERTARSRKGTAAAFRFNLEALLPRHPELSSVHQVFLGPVRDLHEAPPCPVLPITAEVLLGFREALCQSAERARSDGGDDPLEGLWAGVFRAALKKAVARLLPPAHREQIELDWQDLVGTQAREEQE
ncbi:hypothetical protein JQX13_53335 [Archangium violaceum]|uniref:hypothetical protein n=1 Tax=Archangium violaceum TaxID=83451 RepID=UPI00193C27D1|nr:hypothetical protein [Archangium violaceum]QRK08583.1 hypothetical protein JQX13_53335 [Archangium violaceum]